MQLSDFTSSVQTGHRIAWRSASNKRQRPFEVSRRSERDRAAGRHDDSSKFFNRRQRDLTDSLFAQSDLVGDILKTLTTRLTVESESSGDHETFPVRQRRQQFLHRLSPLCCQTDFLFRIAAFIRDPIQPCLILNLHMVRSRLPTTHASHHMIPDRPCGIGAEPITEADIE